MKTQTEILQLINQAFRFVSLLKWTMPRVFYCEACKIFQNSHLPKHLWTTACSKVISLKGLIHLYPKVCGNIKSKKIKISCLPYQQNDFPDTAQKKKFSVKDLFSKCKQILNGKLYFLYSERNPRWLKLSKINSYRQIYSFSAARRFQ